MANHIDMPTIRRYLAALAFLAGSTAMGSAFAREALRDMALPGVLVTDYLAPLATLPFTHLTPDEQAIRLLAQGGA